MEKVEQYIKEHTRNCSNDWYDDLSQGYEPWLTPDDARAVAKIAREETIKEVCEWLYNHNDYICGSTNGIARYDMDKLIEDLKIEMKKSEQKK